jgi:hypothetical protein
VCALAHKLEERGFSTVALAGVRAQAEKTQPPRALWTAGQLGRPVAEPEDPDFQLRVIRAALALLERQDGPVILADFPDDPPSWTDNPGWTPPMTAPSTCGNGAEWQTAFAAELAEIVPRWHAAQTRFGRTSIGLSFQAPEVWPSFAAQVLDGGLPVVAQLDTTALSVRFLCDDIKALYGEAAQAVGPQPSSMQVDTWFWRHTVAGAMLQALRRVAMASEHSALKTVGGRFFVPTPWVV